MLSSLPELGGHEPAGILGMNLLSLANFACLTYPAPGETGHLRLSNESHVSLPETTNVPFTRVGNRLFVTGAVDGASVTFIFVTEARRTHLHPDIAKDREDSTTVHFHPGSGRTTSAEVINTLQYNQVIRPGKVTLSEFNFEKPVLNLEKDLGHSKDDDLEVCKSAAEALRQIGPAEENPGRKQ